MITFIYTLPKIPSKPYIRSRSEIWIKQNLGQQKRGGEKEKKNKLNIRLLSVSY